MWVRRHGVEAVAALLLAVGVAHLVLMLLRQPLDLSDFRYIWTAGDVWAARGNPYSRDYADAGARLFPAGPYPVRSWVYPFHWYLPARFAAMVDPKPSFAIWITLTSALLALGGWLIAAAARRVGAGWKRVPTLLAIAYVCSSTPLTFLLRHGHPAGLAIVGVAVIAYGLATRRPYLTGLGAALALLKPHLGLPVVAGLLFMPRGIAALATGAAITVLASLPAFLGSGFRAQIDGLLRQSTGGYQAIDYNSAAFMSGLPHFVALAGGYRISLAISMIVATLVAAAAVALTRGIEPNRRVALFVTLTGSIAATFVSLHGYDLTILFLLLPFLPLLAAGELIVAAAGYALLWRTENLARALGDFWYTPTIQSIAAVLILAAWLATARRWSAEGARGA